MGLGAAVWGIHRFVLLAVAVVALSSPRLSDAFSSISTNQLGAATTTTPSTTALMGLKGFRGWFESHFESSVTQIKGSDSDRFDHVLIDMNPLLHICMRKSRNDGHGLTLLLKELDSIIKQIKPQQSLVLAIDGPPSAAKLTTQRKRRWAVVRSVSSKLQRLEAVGSKRLSTKQITQRKRRIMSETRTICITPGTEFMRLAEQAILYWAWQRLEQRSGLGGSAGVKVFLSPSEVPGEGEVKLLEWIYKKPRRGESIAILSGDSDLVLEALLIPIQSTHNVFVIWPGSSSSKVKGRPSEQFTCISLHETTRRLQELVPNISFHNLMRLRTDLVLLLILNGNDYLPKLRGCAGFNKLFGNYVRMQQEQHRRGKAEPMFLVDPDTLEFQVDSCIDYFQRLAKFSYLPDERQKPKPAVAVRDRSSRSPLHRLRTFTDAGYLPKPVQFRSVYRSSRAEMNGDSADPEEIVSEDDDDDLASDFIEEDADDGGGDDYDNSDEEEEVDIPANQADEVLLQLWLGVPGSDDAYMYETWCPSSLSRKDAKHELARMALFDLLDVEEDEDDVEEIARESRGSYDWELQEAVEAKVDSYLYGLVWNLQTYQEGICSDYSWNYGKRRSPTAKEVQNFFVEAKSADKKVGLMSLRSGPFSPPISAGVACLAALPSSEKYLVPEPYRWLADETVEDIFGACVDKHDNTFDATAFERMCNDYVSGLPRAESAPSNETSDPMGDGRRIMMSDHLWTVVSRVSAPLTHPFDPPLPFTDNLSSLRPNNRIRISKVSSIQRPRPRAAWGDKVESSSDQHGFLRRDSNELNHSDPAPFMINLTSIKELHGKMAYPKSRASRKTQRESMKPPSLPSSIALSSVTTGGSSTALVSATTKDGMSAVTCLKQLEDGRLIGKVKWEESAVQGYSEKTRLRVMKGGDSSSSSRSEDLLFEHVRDVRTVSKKAIRQHLATLALNEIVGQSKNWPEHSFKDLRLLLRERQKQGTSSHLDHYTQIDPGKV